MAAWGKLVPVAEGRAQELPGGDRAGDRAALRLGPYEGDGSSTGFPPEGDGDDARGKALWLEEDQPVRPFGTRIYHATLDHDMQCLPQTESRDEL